MEKDFPNQEKLPKPESYDIDPEQIKSILKFLEQMSEFQTADLTKQEKIDFVKNDLEQQLELIKAGARIGENNRAEITGAMIKNVTDELKVNSAEHLRLFLDKKVENQFSKYLTGNKDVALNFLQEGGEPWKVTHQLYEDREFIDDIITSDFSNDYQKARVIGAIILLNVIHRAPMSGPDTFSTFDKDFVIKMLRSVKGDLLRLFVNWEKLRKVAIDTNEEVITIEELLSEIKKEL